MNGKKLVKARPRGVYIVKSSGPNGPEFVVRISAGDGGDMAVCGCPGKWEAGFVRQCIIEACGSRNPSVRLEMMLREIERDFGGCGLRRPSREPTRLNADAARYRYLRSHGLDVFDWGKLTCDTCDVGLDYAIDQRIAALINPPTQA